MKGNLVWVDMEMSGLDPNKHVILEIATIVTDSNLQTIAEGPNIAIYYPDEILDSMEEWSLNHHTASGLLDQVMASSIDCAEAEHITLKFLSKNCIKGESPLCGNSVGQDRRFMMKYMKNLENFLHYRIIDVSTLKELAQRWYPSIPPFNKKDSHLALEDIKESIEELKYYRKEIFLTH